MVDHKLKEEKPFSFLTYSPSFDDHIFTTQPPLYLSRCSTMVDHKLKEEKPFSFLTYSPSFDDHMSVSESFA
ncbi:hypothetical protein F2Q70_00045424 [Brassica cretica]|uniref:Uncharacterized protein n=1 Tax=Brassica cretica TaxID=69181 RepID=A0A8S9KP26_BRACR|nr:hypothetical protein F2Q70_00045424 [Brassica cretica]